MAFLAYDKRFKSTCKFHYLEKIGIRCSGILDQRIQLLKNSYINAFNNALSSITRRPQSK